MLAMILKFAGESRPFAGADGIDAQDDKSFLGKNLAAPGNNRSDFSLRPMAVHVQDCRERAGTGGPKKQCRHPQSRTALIGHLCDAISLLSDAAMLAELEVGGGRK